jgi:maltose/moltooligosaccharide transporter
MQGVETERGVDRTGASFAKIANISAGLFGVQIVWGLQSANTSRIFQGHGASVADLPLLWIAAPITGLMVQPLVGWLSDHTGGRFGRRRPYLAVGAVCTALAMLLMARATSLGWAVVALWLLTASVNVTMQPLRALLADAMPPSRRMAAYAAQVIFIGLGAVFASVLPWLLNHLGVASGGPAGQSSRAVALAFDIGAVCLLVSTGWTLLSVRELAEPLAEQQSEHDAPVAPQRSSGPLWLVTAVVVAAVAAAVPLKREIWLLAAIMAGWGAALIWLRARVLAHGRITGPLQIVADIVAMPQLLRRLGVTQFFCWFALFAMWVYAVPAIAGRIAVPGTAAYDHAANWVGVVFGFYDAVAIVVAFVLPRVAGRLGMARAHALALGLGAVGMFGLSLPVDSHWLVAPSLLIGFAWASILSTPYALVTAAAPAGKRGVYLGIANIFLVLPQLVAAALLGPMVERWLQGEAALVLVIAAAAMGVAALTSLRLSPD